MWTREPSHNILLVSCPHKYNYCPQLFQWLQECWGCYRTGYWKKSRQICICQTANIFANVWWLICQKIGPTKFLALQHLLPNVKRVLVVAFAITCSLKVHMEQEESQRKYLSQPSIPRWTVVKICTDIMVMGMERTYIHTYIQCPLLPKSKYYYLLSIFIHSGFRLRGIGLWRNWNSKTILSESYACLLFHFITCFCECGVFLVHP